jgi:hypothetical protein
MTIAAVKTQAAYMMLVTELYWLLAHDTLFGGIAGPIERREEPQQSCYNEHCSQNADTRNGIRAWMKDLSHTR